MKEIGGYLEFERFYGSEYYEGLLRFDSVRSAFIYAVKQRRYRKLYIPYYLCGCIKEILMGYNIDYESYHINEQFQPILNKTMQTDECLFFVNYFGQFTNDELLLFKEKYKNIFIDNTQSFFQKPVKGIDTAYSCRKYFGVSDGAYLSTDLPEKDIYENLPFDTVQNKMLYTMGRFETSAIEYYPVFIENEKIKRGQPIQRMSRFIQNTLKGIDYHRIIHVRDENFNYLKNYLNEKNKVRIKNNAGLFFYPLLVENGNLIKKKLIENKIYVPTLWPNVFDDTTKDSIEYYYTNNIVFLPLDQRYNIADMKYMINILKNIR
jgi:hypothetical protein